MRYLVSLVFGFIFLISGVLAQVQITASEAIHHVGETATVCGKVASTRYARRSTGKPTFLNLDKPYPDQILTAVIWGKDRNKFSPVQRGLTKTGTFA